MDGAVMLPAFIDSHSHITAVAQVLGTCDLSGTADFAEIRERLERFKVKMGAKPLEVPAMEIRDIKVLETIKEGITLYQYKRADSVCSRL